MTEQELCNLFYAGKTKNTIISYKREIENFLAAVCKKSYASVTKDDVKKYYDNLITQMNNGTKKRATVIRILRTLHKFYNLGIENNVFSENWFNHFKVPKQDVGYVKEDRIFTLDELERFLTCAKNSGTRDYLIVLLFITSRFSVLEVKNICWGNLIIDALGHYGAEVKSKAGKRRIIPIRKDVFELFIQYRSELGLPPQIDREKEANNPIFLNRYGQPLSETGVRKIVYKLCEEAEVKHISPKDLFHMCMILGRIHGATDSQLVDQAGFSDVKFLEKYKYALRILQEPACNFIQLPKH
ncbi:MAG: tyrosine-type recombinase/integrase [Clostridiaceae bacterium]|nr:tyrosine-type recombinase/integrase [Clostridiaceae bacterium]